MGYLGFEVLAGDQSRHILQEGDLLFIARAVEHVIQPIDLEGSETEPHPEFSLS